MKFFFEVWDSWATTLFHDIRHRNSGCGSFNPHHFLLNKYFFRCGLLTHKFCLLKILKKFKSGVGSALTKSFWQFIWVKYVTCFWFQKTIDAQMTLMQRLVLTNHSTSFVLTNSITSYKVKILPKDPWFSGYDLR